LLVGVIAKVIIIEVGGIGIVSVPTQQVEPFLSGGGGIDEGCRFHLLEGDFDAYFSQLSLDFLGYLVGAGQVSAVNHTEGKGDLKRVGGVVAGCGKCCLGGFGIIIPPLDVGAGTGENEIGNEAVGYARAGWIELVRSLAIDGRAMPFDVSIIKGWRWFCMKPM